MWNLLSITSVYTVRRVAAETDTVVVTHLVGVVSADEAQRRGCPEKVKGLMFTVRK